MFCKGHYTKMPFGNKIKTTFFHKDWYKWCVSSPQCDVLICTVSSGSDTLCVFCSCSDHGPCAAVPTLSLLPVHLHNGTLPREALAEETHCGIHGDRGSAVIQPHKSTVTPRTAASFLPGEYRDCDSSVPVLPRNIQG